MDLTFRPVDADQHYYEKIDSCTRHLDPRFKDRGVQIVEQGTHKLLLAGGRLFRFIPNPTFNPVIVPGCLDPMDKLVISDRAIHDTIGNLVVHGVFTRHPKLRVASIENGSDWVHTLVKRLRKQANQTPWWFEEDPVEAIRTHVWITPYYEEDMRKLADTLGTERVLFGSDWPHGEGLAEPTDFVKELHAFSDAEIEQVMRTNALDYLGERS